MEYRELTEGEIDRIWEIDRSEYVAAFYSYRHGQPEETRIEKDFKGWPPGEDRIYGPILKDCFRRGGFFLGGFDAAGRLRAVVVLDPKWIGRSRNTVQLSFLHIDKACRKRGVGRILFEKAVERARSLGAERVYVSACESKNAVDFYRHMGCRLTDDLDEELFQREPKDIHMDFLLGEG